MNYWGMIEERYETDVADDIKLLCEGYAAGINRFLEDNPDHKKRFFDPAHYRFLSDILRFNKKAKVINSSLSPRITVGEFFEQYRFSRRFYEKYFLPMAAAIWSSPTEKIVDFPFRSMIEFYEGG